MTERKAILCVGNEMMGDDGAGPLLAEKLAANPLPEWRVFNGGSAPEMESLAIREWHPDLLLVIDATEMGLNPGEIRQVDPDTIAEMMLMNTHSMPLNFLLDDLRPDVGEIVMLGLQPDIVGFYYPMSPTISAAVNKLEAALRKDIWRDFSPLTTDMKDVDSFVEMTGR